MNRWLRRLALALGIFAAFPALAQTAYYPLVLNSGQFQQLPSTSPLLLRAPTTSNASIRLPHGTAPSSPVNGDCWTTTAGLYCFINGVTQGPFGVAGAGSLTVTDGTHSVSSTTTETFGNGFVVGGSAGSATVNVTVPDRSVASGGTTIGAGDIGGQVNSTDASAQTFTQPSTGTAGNGQSFLETNQGAGTVALSGGQTLNGLAAASLYQYGWAACTGNGSSADCFGWPGFGIVSGDGTISATGSLSLLHLTHVTDGSLANSGLANSSLTVCGTSISLGGSGNPNCTGIGATTIVAPQGRLTLVSGTPVLAADEAAKSTIYYDCYRGANVPYYNGSTDLLDSISSCEVSLTMVAGASTVGGDNSTTGGINNAGVFDIWWVHGGANRLCIANGAASSHSGGGWSSDTGGSTTARGTGYSQVHNTRGYWTNVNSIAHCWNGSTDYGSISADQATYLGTIFTTAAGQTGVVMVPATASGGNNSTVGLWNAYWREPITSRSWDSTSSWTYASATVRSINGNNNNRVNIVDGLAQSQIRSRVAEAANANATSCQAGIGVGLDSTTTITAFNAAVGSLTSTTAAVAPDHFAPQFGAHFLQGLEFRVNGTCTITFFGNGAEQVEVDFEY